MDLKQAKNLIRETFNDSFDKLKFISFIKELLNEVDVSKAQRWSKQYVKHAFHGSISRYERIGTYTAPKGEKVDILIVYLEKETTLERARTLQRNFVAHHLKTRAEKDAGIIAFVSPNNDDWRFSLVKMEYNLEKTDEGGVKVREDITPSKRFSFIVGKNENSHTAQKQLLPILKDDEHNPTFEEIEEAFSIETVTKEFFNKYKDLFLHFKEELDKLLEKDSSIKQDFESKGIHTADFAKKLLGQIVFLYFLQRKGWLGVKKNDEWGDGPKSFLRALFEKKYCEYANFFNDVLEPLFYEALATDRGEKAYYSRFDCRIPFLNGGLFEPLQNYDWENTDIVIHDELFSNDVKTKEGDIGSGILDFFDRYNFTIKEDEPLEKEVAIDPEMLGKVFENLLEIKDRKSKGAYYTPREIVHYMCQESLINYLESELEGKVPREDIETFIHLGDFAVEHDMAKTQGIVKDDGKYKLPKSVHEHAELVDQKLADITVCDPAIGSGAFPVGMMNEIVRSRGALNATKVFENTKNKRTPYFFKHHAIQNSLYGVDIEPGAVEIAKLRLWLSLVVDEDDMTDIKPLPNLDYKIMQGNSLLEEYEGIRLFDESLIGMGENAKKTEQMGLFDEFSESKKKREELEKLHKQFFDSSQRTDKEELKKKIEELEWELIKETLKEQGKEKELPKLEKMKVKNNKPFFLWKLHFAEVFQEKGGFDVVIANPPYIQFQKLDLKFREALRRNPFYESQSDLWYFFVFKSHDLLRNKGQLTLIVSNYFLQAGHGGKLRRFISDKLKILVLINFTGSSVFENTGIHNVVLLSEKKVASDYKFFYLKYSSVEKFPNDYQSKEQLSDKSLGSTWRLLNPVENTLLNKLIEANQKLGDFCKISNGIKSGSDKVFVLPKKNKKTISIEGHLLKDYLKNSEIHRYYVDTPKKEIIYTHSGITLDKYPSFKAYISKFKNSLCEKWEKRGENFDYWKLYRPREEIYISEPDFGLIITSYRTKCLGFAMNEGYLSGTDTYLIKNYSNRINSKILLGILNSKLIRWIYKKIAKRKGDIYEISTAELSILPIAYPSEETGRKILQLVAAIISLMQRRNVLMEKIDFKRKNQLDDEIDKMIYKLYDLTPEEIEIVENN